MPDADIATPGKATIQLQTPADNTGSGGGLSNSVVFEVFDSGNATTTDFTSAAEFDSAASNLKTIVFNGILQSGQDHAGFSSPLNIYGISFSTPTQNVFVNVTSSGYYAPKTYLSDFIVDSTNQGPSNTLVITLSTPTHVIGLNYGGLSTGTTDHVV